tara:strand:- start:187 stop:1431 length:1245 start_codon:yes stop_codon:yes gene_type:complete
MKWIGYKSLTDISTYFFPAGIAVKKGDAKVSITNTDFSDAGTGGELNLNSDDGAVMASGHRLGVINFKGAEDTSSTLTVGARIEATCDATWSTTENGASLKFYTTDGNASTSKVLTLDSDKKASFSGLVEAQSSINILNKNTSSAIQGGTLKLQADDDAALGSGHRLGVIEFQAAIDSGNTLNTGSKIEAIAENLFADEEASTSLKFYTTDSATESVVLTLDSNKLATFAGAATITGLTTLNGGLTFDSVALTAVQTASESFADNDTSIMTSAAIDDAILKGGSTTTIKILPHQFMSNEDGGVNKSEQYDDTGTIGVRASSADAELYAFVEIPIGKTATSVTIYGSDTNNVVEVFEADIRASGLTDRTPGAGCVVGTACDMDDVAGSAANYLAIKVTVTATSDIVYGGALTVSG